MSTENQPDKALDDWQKLIAGVNNPTPAQPIIASSPAPAIQTEIPAEPVAQTEVYAEPGEGELACAICYRIWPIDDLTVTSKERFNWQQAVVVCPECLTELKLEMRVRSSGADLALGLVWAVVGFVLMAGLLSVGIYSVRADTANTAFWSWLGCYFAVVPGFIIGRLVRYGVGRRQSLEQQLIAMFFTFAVCVATAYAGFVAYNNSFYEVLTRTNNSSEIGFPPFTTFLTGTLWPAITGLTDFQNILVHIGIDVGIIVGLYTAYVSSEGARIYTRPYKPEDALAAAEN